MQAKVILLAIIFLFSRFIFINLQTAFFDSSEYIVRFSNPNFLEAIYQGHIPLHLGYVLIFWPIYQTFSYLGQNPLYFVLFFQVLLSFAGVISFYKVIEFIGSKKLAFISAFIACLLPLLWITNVSIMMETTYISFFFISLYFLTKYLKRNNLLNLLLFLLFWGLSFLTHSAILLWTPFIFYLVLIKNKKYIARITLFFLVNFILFSFVNAFFVSLLLNKDLLQGMLYFYLKPLEARSTFNFSFASLVIFSRNFIIPLLRNNTSLIVIMSFISLCLLFKKNKQLFILSFLWITPSLITNQWWDSLFFGRHALIASFAFAYLTALLIQKYKFAVIAVIFYLLITVTPAMLLLRTDSPYIVLKNEVVSLPAGGLYIESHFARPQLDNMYPGNQYFVDEPSYAAVNLKSLINTTLNQDKPVFISSQALSEPYGLYSGPYLHNLSLSYKNEFVLKNILENYSLKPYLTINKEDNLIIYRINSINKSTYPKVMLMDKSMRRLDYYDPIFKAWAFIFKK